MKPQLGFLGLAFLPAIHASKPDLPLSSSSRWIVDATGARIKLRCINWAAHLETNVPEGLHKKSIAEIADWIAANDFNCVRLTYSVDMALHPTQPVRDAFVAAAAATEVAEEAMLALYDAAVARNPFLADAGVRDVHEAVVAALWDRDVMTVLDNHVSKASWCCDLEDGNGWWSDAPIPWPDNSRYFDSDEWLASLQAMALWALEQPGVVGISLRNELRESYTQIAFGAQTWLERVPPAALTIHEANPDVLVVVGGHLGGGSLMPMREKDLAADWKDKNVWEAHDYPFTVTTPDWEDCDFTKANYGLLHGFALEQDQPHTGPLWISEFGVDMEGGTPEENGGLSDEHHEYLTCLVSWLESNDADWALWAVQGSYYVRDRVVDKDETWGALDRDWNDWRNPDFRGLLGKMWNVTQGP